MEIGDSLLEEFNFIGITPSTNILDKCEEACRTYDVSPEIFVELWTAHSVSKLNGAAPTLDSINIMIRKELGSSSQKKHIQPIKTEASSSNIKVYGDSSLNLDSEVLETYGSNYTNTPKRGVKQEIVSPHNTPKILSTVVPLGVSPKHGFSPATYSPTVGQSSTSFADRKDALEVAVSYKSKGAIQVGKKFIEPTFTGNNKGNISLKLYGDKDDWTPNNVLYMYARIKAKERVAGEITDWLGRYLMKKHELGEAFPFRLKLNEPFCTFGQIRRDRKGYLNPDSLVFQSDDRLSGGKSILLDLTNLPEYTVFPGQVLAVRAINPAGDKLVAEKIYSDAKVPLPTTIPVFGDDPIQIVTACGPFTLLYNLAYEPLQELLKYVVKHKPDVLILIGPFVDCEHPHIANPTTMAETFDCFFETLIDLIMQPLAELSVQVVMVSSQRDAHHHCVYPTPPFISRNAASYRNLHFVPDPCILDINGVAVGVTSTDILFHFSKEQVSSSNLTIDRIGRFCARIIEQQSFYPLYPSSKDVNMDKLLLEKYGNLIVTPHILILPSTFRFFVKNISDSLVVNPERLSKGNVGGTFARMEILPTTSNSLVDTTAVDILRI